jgi:uncharacterized protein
MSRDRWARDCSTPTTRWRTARPLDDRRHALDHLEVKLFPVAAAMQTAAGRRMAAERIEWMRQFRHRLMTEIG